ncbi:NAD(P)-binding domain [Penicillium camemberti]|uniref:NAD(P)-binding domain n=1 Tax=Penicillium camemberti (strain FM 013) TaxID=1429867 RepID=A0A0G4P8B8_PENC3|nr:NAD(P)-binding domain [Penicillium camemberti]
MPSNILITGAAGYIGGSIVADFLARKTISTDVDRLIAAVRSEDQANSLSNLGVRVIQLDLTDEDTVVKSVLSHNTLHLITALSKQGEVSGEKTYFIHTSGLGAFFENTGWPAGPFKDTDAVFDTEKELADSSPLRKKVSSVHISDLTALYGRIIENILQGEPIPAGREGYYFALAHYLHLGEVLDHLAIQLKARDLISDSKTKIYLNDEAAASSLGIPVPFVRPLWNSGDNIIAEIPHKIGWRPMWNKERFLQNIDDEIQAVVEHGKAKSSLIDSLFEFAAGQ